MKDGKYGFIYITTNLINGKRYIGQKKYDSYWKSYLGSGSIFKQAIKKYGRENFKREIIEECDNSNKLNEREIFWITYYDAIINDNFYNLQEGGGICPLLEGTNHPLSKKVICLNTLEIFTCIREAAEVSGCSRICISGCCVDKYHRTKSSLTGNWLTWMFLKDYESFTDDFIKNKLKKCVEGFVGKNNPFYGKVHTKEVKEKIKETKQKILLKTTNRKIICLTTNNIFQSIAEAEKYYNIHSVSSACQGKRRYAGKYDGKKLIWMYYDEYLTNENIVQNKLNVINDKYPTVNNKTVKCINTNEVFNSIGKAEKWCNLKSGSNIGKCCEGNVNYAGKHPITGEKLKWEYVFLK